MLPEYGKKHTCFKCSCTFYDLNRTTISCPKCQTDQAEAGNTKIGGTLLKDVLSTRKTKTTRAKKKKTTKDDDEKKMSDSSEGETLLEEDDSAEPLEEPAEVE